MSLAHTPAEPHRCAARVEHVWRVRGAHPRAAGAPAAAAGARADERGGAGARSGGVLRRLPDTGRSADVRVVDSLVVLTVWWCGCRDVLLLTAVLFGVCGEVHGVVGLVVCGVVDIR